MKVLGYAQIERGESRGKRGAIFSGASADLKTLMTLFIPDGQTSFRGVAVSNEDLIMLIKDHFGWTDDPDECYPVYL